MSLLGDLAKSALGNVLGGQQSQQSSDPKAQMLNMAVSLLKSQGGIDGLMSKFNSAGLGDMMSQWISTGPNPPATAGQIEKVLGKDQLEGLAKESGQSSSAVADGIARILPGLIDKLTPNGQAVQGDLLQAALKGGLGKLFG
jgi:uncharacterized protein YidB (DUF937 family)